MEDRYWDEGGGRERQGEGMMRGSKNMEDRYWDEGEQRERQGEEIREDPRIWVSFCGRKIYEWRYERIQSMGELL